MKADLPPTLPSMWRLCRLGYRHEPGLMIAAASLALLSALPDALFALWFKLIADGAIQRNARLVFFSAAALGVSATATWFLRIVSTRDKRAKMGYGLARAHWGHGYATEAGRLLVRFGFEQLGLVRIQAACAVENERSARTLERIGMQREGRLAHYRWKGERPTDHYLYALTRADLP